MTADNPDIEQLRQHLSEEGFSEDVDFDQDTVDRREWWANADQVNREMAFIKREAYGSADMVIMGAAMRVLAEGSPWTPTEAQAEELAIGFYILGKVSRAFGAWAQGKDPSEDTWVDTEVYSRMARAVREFGAW